MSKKRIRKNKNKKFIRGAVSQKRKKVLFTSVNLLGDSICITPAIATWYLHNRENWDIYLYVQDQEFCRVFEKLPFVHKLEYHNKWEPLREPHKYFKGFDYYHNFNISVSWSIGVGNKLHMTEAYSLALEQHPGDNKPVRIRLPIPILHGIEDLGEEENIAVSPFSTSSDPETKDFRSSKVLGFEVFSEILKYLQDKYKHKIFVYGTSKDPHEEFKSYCKPLDIDFVIDEPIRSVISKIVSKKTKIIITIDNGIAHCISGQMFFSKIQIPTIQIYPKALPITWVNMRGVEKLITVHCEPKTTDYAKIKEKRILEQLDSLIKENEKI